MRPVLDILKLNIRIPVNKVDADQLLTVLTLKAWQALTHCSSQLFLTEGTVLTLSKLARQRGRKGHLTKLTTEEEKEVIIKDIRHDIQRNTMIPLPTMIIKPALWSYDDKGNSQYPVS